MNETDKELLELAAKAAGYQYLWNIDSLLIRGLEGRWNPLTDDGDALRLAVKLNLDVFHSWTYAKSELEPLANVVVGYAEQAILLGEIKGDDPYAATRRAIVRAAAEIGEGK